MTTVTGLSVEVDRGADAQIQLGDLAVFFPAGEQPVEGTVVAVGERSASIVPTLANAVIHDGTRGEVMIPTTRTEEGGATRTIPEHPPWEFVEGKWNADMPLLAQVKAVRPEERTKYFTGRVYVMLDNTWDNEYDREDSFFRVGADVTYENPFGRGGGLNLDAETNYRSTRVPDQDDENEVELRLDRLSYYWGGTRFKQDRWEVGRFLQHGMPEFGVTDGASFSRRLSNGDSWGASAGFMPEPNSDYSTGKDLQTSVFYRHLIGEDNRLSVDAGFQKTWHEGRADRDLLVAKARYYQKLGWNFYGTAWVDIYTSGEQAKSSGPEVTQLYALAGYRWSGGNGLNLSYSHLRFPDIRRNEFLPVTLQELVNNRTDRLSISGYRRIQDDIRLYGRVSAWNDEDSSGGGGEVRVDVSDWFLDRSRTSASLFTNEGQFGSVLGVRFSLSRYMDSGSWDAFWEVANHQQNNFSGTQENLLQHRLHASWNVHSASDWNWSVYAEDRFGDQQGSVSLGVFLQKHF